MLRHFTPAKPLLLLLFAVATIPSAVRAVDLTFGAAISSGFAGSDGIDLEPGSLVRVGTFSLTPAQIGAAADNLALLNLSWIEIGTAFIGDGNPTGASGGNSDPANAGLFNGTVYNINTSATGLNIAGSTLYYWVFNAATVDAATQHGIFGSTAWTIPSGSGGFGDSALDTDIDDLADAGSLAVSALLIVGSFGPGINDTAGGPDFSLAAIAGASVPEPAATALLGAIGAFALACGYRRFVCSPAA